MEKKVFGKNEQYAAQFASQLETGKLVVVDTIVRTNKLGQAVVDLLFMQQSPLNGVGSALVWGYNSVKGSVRRGAMWGARSTEALACKPGDILEGFSLQRAVTFNKLREGALDTNPLRIRGLVQTTTNGEVIYSEMRLVKGAPKDAEIPTSVGITDEQFVAIVASHGAHVAAPSPAIAEGAQ